MSLPSPSSKRVLVVEDNEATRDAVSLILQRDGFEVQTADNGRDALDQLRTRERPSLILLDLMMPVMDGWQFRAEQRGDKALADIPVVICTAAGEAPEHAEALGAAAYLTKPIEVADLLHAVRSCC